MTFRLWRCFCLLVYVTIMFIFVYYFDHMPQGNNSLGLLMRGIAKLLYFSDLMMRVGIYIYIFSLSSPSHPMGRTLADTVETERNLVT